MCLTGTIRPTWSLRVLHRYLHAGDIILFQSKNPLSGLQRHLTGSEWDHIGMVVPYPTHPQTLALLEVTGDGVTVLPLVLFSTFHVEVEIINSYLDFSFENVCKLSCPSYRCTSNSPLKGLKRTTNNISFFATKTTIEYIRSNGTLTNYLNYFNLNFQ